MRWLLMLSILLSNLSFSSDIIYKWVDENGKVFFTDRPVKGAIKLPPTDNDTNILSTPKMVLDQKQQMTQVQYQLAISSPQADKTIRDNQGNFEVYATISPMPPAQTHYQLLLNGKSHGKVQSQPIFELKNIDRGGHNIQVQALTPAKKILAKSPPQKIYLHRTHINRRKR